MRVVRAGGVPPIWEVVSMGYVLVVELNLVAYPLNFQTLSRTSTHTERSPRLFSLDSFKQPTTALKAALV